VSPVESSPRAGALGPRRKSLDSRSDAPSWSLPGLRVLAGFALREAPEACAAVVRPSATASGRAWPACALLFEMIGRALTDPVSRRALDGLLAALLAREAAPFVGRPIAELAARADAERLARGERAGIALLWLLGRHPCTAARLLEARIAERIAAGAECDDQSSMPNGPS
jgi:hypothetical protein